MQNRYFPTIRVPATKLKKDEHLLNAALLRVNKQIYAEALPLLYHQPLFFKNPAALYYFLTQIGTDAVQFIPVASMQSLALGSRKWRKIRSVEANVGRTSSSWVAKTSSING